ncbi:MAG: hypothetical protein MZU97_23760 [Bacillus subtilis]|nr:hypothetical protein [Bacillus subtilis]
MIGLAAGIFGIAFSLLINIPVNLVIANLIGVDGFSVLTIANAVSLIVLSTILTLIAGLIPSGIAARKDPVIALRTE